MHRILLAFGGLLVGLLAALFIAPIFIDWNRYRGVLEEEATRLLGREVRVGGRIDIKFLPTPSLSVQQIRLADTQALVGAPLFRAEAVKMGLAIGPLFHGDVQITHVEMRKPELTLVLDGKGSGNWSTLADRKLQAVLAPSRVALDDVRFTDGIIAVLESDGAERTRLERVAGQLSAADLEGPYRLTASFDFRGHAGELKLGTARADADGAVRLKGSVTIPRSKLVMTLDGAARDVLTRPRLDGLVKARVGESPEQKPAKGAEAAFEVGGQLTADTSGAHLGGLSVSFERAGRPQLASGEARLVWGAQPSLDVTLASRWIDLDSLGLTHTDTTLVARTQAIIERLMGALPDAGSTRVRLGLDQATFGGDIAGAIALTIARQTGPPAVTLSALLPGGSHIHISGVLARTQDRSRFAGKLSLGGASFRRFLAWATAAKAPALAADGAFQLDGNASLQDDRSAIEGMTARLLGSEVRGSVAFGEVTGRRILNVSLAGGELDLDKVFGEALTVENVRARLFESVVSPPAKRYFETVVLRLDLGLLHVAGMALGDVQAAIDIAEGKLSVSRLSAHGAEGWSIDGKAALERSATGLPQGTSAVALSATAPAGLSTLARIAGLTPPWLPSADRAGRVLPLHLSGRVKLDAAQAAQATVSIDGTLARSRIAASMQMSSLDASWRDRPTDLSVTVTGGDATALADLLSARVPNTTPGAADPARIVLRGIGKPGAGLDTLLAAEMTGNTLQYRGRVAVTDAADFVADGHLDLALTDAGRMLAGLGLPFDGPLMRRSVHGAMTLAYQPSGLHLEASDLSFAGTQTRLALDIASPGSARKLSGSIATKTASLPAILGALTLARSRPVEPRREDILWSDEPFDLAQFADHPIDIEFDATSLDIGGGVSLRDAKAHVAAAAGRVTLALGNAAAIGGSVKGEIRLIPVPAGAAAEVDVSVQGVRIEALFSPPMEAAAKGVLSTKMHLAGQALSPRGLIAALRGTGGLELGVGQIYRLSPDAIRQVAEAVLSKSGELSPEDIRSRLLAALAQGSMPLQPGRLGVEVADGVIRLAPMQLRSNAGRATGIWTVDLESMRYDAEWRIEPLPKAGGEGRAAQPLPAITVVYTGPLSQIAGAEPRLQSEDFEREVVVRKMERDLAELEHLRKLDEERARRETEYQRQLDEERARLERERANAHEPGATQPRQATPPQGGRTDLAPTAPAPALTPSVPALPAAVPNLNTRAATNDTPSAARKAMPPVASRPRVDRRLQLNQRRRYFGDQDRANP